MKKKAIELYLKTKRLIKAIQLKGSEFQCTFCNWKFREMMFMGHDNEAIKKYNIIGAGSRKCRCPYCFSSDRERLIFEYLKKSTKIFHEKVKILHIAPEPNLYNVLSKAESIQYYCGDKFAKGYSYKGHVSKMDITDLSYEDFTFDLIICNHVLEHIENDNKAISELFRVLNTGGSAILQVPISYQLKETFEDPSIVDPKEKFQHFGQKDHVRIYGKDYFDRLRKVGFKVTEVDFYNLNKNLSIRICLDPEEKLFIAVKNNQ